MFFIVTDCIQVIRYNELPCLFSERPCPDGYWGTSCHEVCDCSQNGSKCDPKNGACQCSPGYIGEQCDELCPAGTFGRDCTKLCVCGKGGSGCDPVSGRCLCQPGYHGPTCDKGMDRAKLKQRLTHCLIKECPPGKWGHNCQEHCDCRNGGTCDFATGACRCTANWTGQKCELPCQDVSKVVLNRYYKACHVRLLIFISLFLGALH